MAKPQSELLQFPRKEGQLVTFPIVDCGCHRSYCGKIDITQHEYIYSRATKEYYTDLECLAHGIDAEYFPEFNSIFFGEWMKVEDFLKEMQAESNISYLTPIA